MTLGQKLRILRVRVNLQQGVICKRLGMSQNYLSLLENNHCLPSLPMLYKLAIFYGETLSSLFEEVDI